MADTIDWLLENYQTFEEDLLALEVAKRFEVVRQLVDASYDSAAGASPRARHRARAGIRLLGSSLQAAERRQLFTDGSLRSLLPSLTDWFSLKGIHDADAPLLRAREDLIDSVLGLDYETTEQHSPPSTAAYAKVPPEMTGIIQTPWYEFEGLFQSLARVGLADMLSVTDLGAGYGRLGFFLALRFPDLYFSGYELNEQRVREAARVGEMLNLEHFSMQAEDLGASSFCPSPADVFFLYDPVHPAVLKKVTRDLREVARARPFLLVARGYGGRLARFFGAEAWLKPVLSLPGNLRAPYPLAAIEIYRANNEACATSPAK